MEMTVTRWLLEIYQNDITFMSLPYSTLKGLIHSRLQATSGTFMV